MANKLLSIALLACLFVTSSCAVAATPSVSAAGPARSPRPAAAPQTAAPPASQRIVSAKPGNTPSVNPETPPFAEQSGFPYKKPEAAPAPAADFTPAYAANFAPTPSANSAPSSAAGPAPPKFSSAAEALSAMSLDDKIAQLFFLDFRKDADGADITEINGEIRGVLERYSVGGVILFSENIKTEEQTKNFIGGLQSLARIPLFVGVDEEGGRILRTRSLDVPRIGAPLKIGASGDRRAAYDAAAAIAGYHAPLGVNLDFAPVADVFTNPENTVIGDRAFSRDAETAAGFVAEFVRGLRGGGPRVLYESRLKSSQSVAENAAEAFGVSAPPVKF